MKRLVWGLRIALEVLIGLLMLIDLLPTTIRNVAHASPGIVATLAVAYVVVGGLLLWDAARVAKRYRRAEDQA